MSCCGHKRQAWREPTARTAEPPTPPPLRNPRTLHHLGQTSLLVQGAATGTTYLFGARGSTLDVDERDVAALLAAGNMAMSKPDDA